MAEIAGGVSVLTLAGLLALPSFVQGVVIVGEVEN